MLNLLLITNEHAYLQLVTEALSMEYVVHSAETRTEGLRLAYAIRPEVILVNIDMPDLAGKLVLAQLCTLFRPSKVKIAAITGGSYVRAKNLVSGLGCHRLMIKQQNGDVQTFINQFKEVIDNGQLLGGEARTQSGS